RDPRRRRSLRSLGRRCRRARPCAVADLARRARHRRAGGTGRGCTLGARRRRRGDPVRGVARLRCGGPRGALGAARRAGPSRWGGCLAHRALRKRRCRARRAARRHPWRSPAAAGGHVQRQSSGAHRCVAASCAVDRIRRVRARRRHHDPAASRRRGMACHPHRRPARGDRGTGAAGVARACAGMVGADPGGGAAALPEGDVPSLGRGQGRALRRGDGPRAPGRGAREGDALVGNGVWRLRLRDPLALGTAGGAAGSRGGPGRLRAGLRRDRRFDDRGQDVPVAGAGMRTWLDGHPVLADDVFDGFTLLEADAGTGKTWTLANLVLRALIERDASIDEIVVVTFTRKAAAELRERILRAVESLESALAGEDVSDPFIAAYLPRCEPERDLHRLRRARALFEEAPISTIHGLCQRILAEQSLSIAQPADAELRDIERAQVEADVQRWWRQVLVEEDAWTVGVLLAAGNSAERLARGLRRLLTDDTREIAPAPVDRSRYVAELRRLAAAAREALAAERDDYAEWLRVTKGVNRGSYSRANVPKWFDQLAEWLDALPGSLSARPRGRDAKLPRERFAASAFAGVTAAPPPFALARLLDEIDALVVGRAGLRAGLLAELRERLAREMAARKREERIQTYDDLLLLTRDALRDESQGEALAQRLRRRYPIVFVDERQDTDPCQREILRRLHAPTLRGEGDPSLSLVLVGDPKQSIYSFRNADIFAYLGARADARRRFRLARNQRACDELVVGLNELFASPGVFALDEIAFAPAL